MLGHRQQAFNVKQTWVKQTWAVSILSIMLFFTAIGAFASSPVIVNEPIELTAPESGSPRSKLFQLVRIAKGLGIPWGLTFIDARTMLVTERSGALRLLDLLAKHVVPLKHPLTIFDRGQGGLLDIAVAPGGQWIYVTFSLALQEAGSLQGATALARFQLNFPATGMQTSTTNWETLIVTRSFDAEGRHFGSRIAFDDAGHVFFSVGDRGHRPNGQDLMTHAGSILRLTMDGKVPPDNPFVARSDALPEIWSYGHRNPQGLAFGPNKRDLWSNEHGPRGGDEINLIRKGGNYGWPVVSHGREYISRLRVGEAASKPGMIDPVKVYIPSIAPGSLLVYSGSVFTHWRGQLFSSALKLKHLNLVATDATKSLSEQRLLASLGERIRAVTQSPEGWIYFSTDNGNIYKMVLLEK